MGNLFQEEKRRKVFRVAAVYIVLVLQSISAFAVEPALDLFGFDLETSEREIRAWVAREGFGPTSTSMPRVEAFVREDVLAGQGVGFAPAADGLDVLFVNQSGITLPVQETVRRLEALYGEPQELVPTGRGYRIRYELGPPSKPGQMVWLVQRSFVGVELTSNAYLAAPNEEPSPRYDWLDNAMALFSQWRMSILYSLGGGIALLVLSRLLPAGARASIGSVLGAVLEPALRSLGFLGSRFFALVFGILLIPSFVISGCTAMAAASEQGTSWFWVVPWVIGVILTIESRDEDEFRYVILAELLFVATFAGVFLEMYIMGAS